MVLDSVDALSDDADTKGPAQTKAGQSAKAKAKCQATPKAKGGPKTTPNKVVEPKPKKKVEAPKDSDPVEPRGAVPMKRPAASLGASGSGGAVPMKRPAGRQTDPNHISTSKSRYPNGVYCIKLFGKEVIRVTSMHLVCEGVPNNLEIVMCN